MLESWSVSKRITSGFAILTVLISVLSVLSYGGISNLGNGYETYREEAKQTLQINELVEDMFEARIAALKFRDTGSDDAAQAVASNTQEIDQVSQNLDAFKNAPEYAAELRAINVLVQEYQSAFQAMRRATSAHNAHTDRMGTTAEGIVENLSSLRDMATEGGNIPLLRAASAAEEKVILARLYTERYALKGNRADLAKADEYVAAANDAMAQVKRVVNGPRPGGVADAAAIALEQYTADLRIAEENRTAIDTLQSNSLDRLGPEIESRYEVTVDAIRADQIRQGEQGQSVVSSMSWMMPLAGLVVVLLSLGISLIVVRSIGAPLRELVTVTGDLTSGKIDLDIKGAEHDHEFGQLAQALTVFRDAQIERRDVIEPQAERERIEREKVVNSVGVGLRKLSEGDLSARLHEAFAPEFEQLRTDFNKAMESMQDAMHSVVMNSGNINNAAAEITQSSDELARRTENQAATLEETAAAMEQLTASVKSTAEGADKANRFVSDTRRSAEASGIVVRETVEAMSQIQQSSDQISQIIGVIDDIAFQTNLLALNAGVEAARAGEAGRGFAVVASEVRALAQRSSDAAKEIKDLISASSLHVESGVDLVGRTGKALNEIAEMVGTISGLVSEISAATNEQSTGLVEINTSVTQLDQVTQQNAAMVEEATAASHELTREANALNQLTARFSMGGSVAPGPRRVAPKAATPKPVSKAIPKAVTQPAPKPAAKPAPASVPVSQGSLSLKSDKALLADDDWSDF